MTTIHAAQAGQGGPVTIACVNKATVDLGVPNVALVEYRAPENYPAAECPLCQAGVPITRF